MRKFFTRFFQTLLVLFLVAVITYLWTYIPIITGYAAKTMCSGIFVSGRSSAEVEKTDLGSFPVFHIPKYRINYLDMALVEHLSTRLLLTIYVNNPFTDRHHFQMTRIA
jgi:hypothetical protein